MLIAVYAEDIHTVGRVRRITWGPSFIARTGRRVSGFVLSIWLLAFAAMKHGFYTFRILILELWFLAPLRFELTQWCVRCVISGQIVLVYISNLY